MKSLISKPTTNEISAYLDNLWPVLLIVGPKGSGKREIVNYIHDELARKGDYVRLRTSSLEVDPDKSSISIEEIRGIKSKLKLTPNANKSKLFKRLAVIHDSQRMTHEAQNALLKLLEDTPSETLFILTATNLRALLPTVASRAQKLLIVNPTLLEAKKYFNLPELEVERLYAMTGGRVSYMSMLINNDPLLSEVINIAKEVVAMNSFDRLTRVDELIKKYDTETLLFALKRIFQTLLHKSNDRKKITKLSASLRNIVIAEEAITRSNPNQKLLMTNLLLNI